MPFTRTDVGGLRRLRQATAPLHEAVEARGDLPGSLHTGADVAGLLRRWWLLIDRLRPLTGSWLDDDPAGPIVADLRLLGGDAIPSSAGPVIDLMRPTTPSTELGTAWVLLGARIGLRTMATHVQRVTRHDLATFAGPDVRTLIVVRDALDQLEGDELAVAIDAARAAFGVAAMTIGGPPWKE